MLIDKDRLYINTFLALFWVRALIGFIADETGAQGLSSAFMLLYDAGLALLGLMLLKRISDKIFLLVFVVAGYWVTCVYNGYSLVFYINGLREFLYILFLLPIFRYMYSSPRTSEFSRRFDQALYIFLWVQVFCLTWQFIKYGANDHGGGSLGNGYSGTISTLIYVISFYLMKRRTVGSTDYFANLANNKDLLFLLIPTFLNETKISFLFLPFYFLLLMPIDRRFLVRMLFMAPITVAILFGVFWLYLNVTENDAEVTSLDYYTEEYLYTDDDELLDLAEALYENNDEDGLVDLPRFTKYIMLPELNSEYPGHSITGYGIGQFKGGTFVGKTKFFEDNEWILAGSVPYGFHLYIQFGLIGVVFMIWFIVNVFKSRVKHTYVDKGVVIYMAIVFVLILFYDSSFRVALTGTIYLYIITQNYKGHKDSYIYVSKKILPVGKPNNDNKLTS